MAGTVTTWALPQLSRLLPLDEDSLKQIITYTDTLPKPAAAEHLKNLLGDSPQALEFISSFNSRRQTPPAETRSTTTNAHGISSDRPSEVPRTQARQAKKKANIHALPARQIEDRGNVTGAYVKRDEQDYVGRTSQPRKHKEPPLANTLALQEKPDALQLPIPVRPPPSAAGPLISDSLAPSTKPSRTSSPAPTKAKVAITGGMAMHGASTALSDLDSAIRSLEVQTNPTMTSYSAADNAKRRCTCMATRHPLLTIAPNCLNCGKIVCVKEGLGPCTFCNSPLLSAHEISSIVRVLKDERGVERQAANNAAHKRADVAAKPKPFSGRDFLSSTSAAASPAGNSPLSSTPASAATSDSEDAVAAAGLAEAKEHRDRLLGYQAQNARRTRIHDEAADFDVPASGTNMWASPAERALQLKRQQKVLRELEWNARPEYEKRRVVASIDLAGGKVVRRMAGIERPREVEDEEQEEHHGAEEDFVQQGKGQDDAKGGAFSRNPLMGALIRPVARADKGKGADGEGEETVKKSTWRRVQDDNDDNEQWILDGGVYGGRIEGRVLGAEEHSFG